MKIKLFLLLTSFIFCNYEYSLEDYNATSPSYGSYIWEPEYLDYITMHYFGTQNWGGWTATFGQLSNFQEELRYDDGYENIVIIGIGQTVMSGSNNSFCANSDLPLVMDSSPNLPIREQFSPYYQSHGLVILNYDGGYLGHIDVTSLGNTQKDYIRSVLEEHYNQSILGDLNIDSVLNIQDIILLVNIILTNQFDDTADLNSDDIINVLDIIQLVNIILS